MNALAVMEILGGHACQLSLTLPDLKAFERRLTEYIACLQPATGRWRSKTLPFFH
uniref:Uncharacterized protein n=1 Tax=Anolis carolinensis TaxID=28377 RepID=A0A803SY29_ANOCA